VHKTIIRNLRIWMWMPPFNFEEYRIPDSDHLLPPSVLP
jgi:hypothetical protein